MAQRKAREADPMVQLANLRAVLQREGLKRGYVLRGDERYFRSAAEKAIRTAAGAAGMELCIHDAKDPDFQLSRLLDDFSSGGLFASARCVVLRSAEAVMTKVGGKDGPLGRALLAFLSSPDEPGIFVINADNLRADHVVAKAVVKAGGILFGSRKLWDTPPPWDPDPRNLELVRWLMGRARELKVKLDVNQAVYVTAATGNDLHALEGQLEKLRNADPDEFRKVVGWEAEGSPFQLAEYLVDGKRGRALGAVETLFQGGFRERDGSRLRESAGLVAILTSSLLRLVRQGLAGSLALESGLGMDAAASAAGVPNTKFARGPFEERVRTRTSSAWHAMLADLAELERRAKSGGVVDANDFAWLAMHWGTDGTGGAGGAGGARGAGATRGTTRAGGRR